MAHTIFLHKISSFVCINAQISVIMTARFTKFGLQLAISSSYIIQFILNFSCRATLMKNCNLLVLGK